MRLARVNIVKCIKVNGRWYLLFTPPERQRQLRLERHRTQGLTQWSKDLTMQITLELPEDIAKELECKWMDLPRAALESLALEAYRSQALTTAQLRRLLGFETRFQVDAFLKEHEVYEVTVADFEHDRETLSQLRATQAQL